MNWDYFCPLSDVVQGTGTWFNVPGNSGLGGRRLFVCLFGGCWDDGGWWGFLVQDGTPVALLCVGVFVQVNPRNIVGEVVLVHDWI